MDKQIPTPIIILNWKGIEDTLECMDSVLKMTYQNFKIYLVDNGSNDGSAEILQDKFGNHPKIELIFNQDNLGFTKANNVVLRQILAAKAVPEFVALLNNDTEVEQTWLGNLLEGAKRYKADVLSSKMIDYYERDKMDNAGHLMLNTGEVIPVGHGQPSIDYNVAKENMGACAGAALYSTPMLRGIGVFDEHFDTGYEDAELGLRAIVCGYECWYEPTAIVYHKMGRSIKKVFNYEYSLSIQKHIWYSYLKLMPIDIIIVSIPSFLFKYIAMLIVNLLFQRKKFLKIMFQSLKEAIWDNRKVTLQARKKIHSKRKIKSFSLSKKQNFFLWTDITRFYKYFILNRHTSMDVYGKVEKV